MDESYSVLFVRLINLQMLFFWVPVSE
ncbi:hypothetical protein ACMD2_03792 [Ananas comosus]|uniref:Uncharacterized protein n=1 Tax=Ananas comosus TaxID=4615 RepID=A0A199UZY4_ANACO|nr:hypothetical protein ACMD2_03792 [Ananas comosus]